MTAVISRNLYNTLLFIVRCILLGVKWLLTISPDNIFFRKNFMDRVNKLL